MPRLPFDPEDPPANPPLACRDPDRWREWYEVRASHVPDRSGACRACGGPHPCFRARLALRVLVDTCAVRYRYQPLPGPSRIVRHATCGWCGQEIELHSVWGWLHTRGALLVCADIPPGGVALGTAEPER